MYLIYTYTHGDDVKNTQIGYTQFLKILCKDIFQQRGDFRSLTLLNDDSEILSKPITCVFHKKKKI